MKGRLRYLRLAYLKPRAVAPLYVRCLSSVPNRNEVVNSKDPAVKPEHLLLTCNLNRAQCRWVVGYTRLDWWVVVLAWI